MRIKEIIFTIPSPRTRALVAIQYGLAARVSEVVEITKSNIIDRGEYFDVLLPNRKAPSIPEKTVPTITKKETWLYEIFSDWLKVCGEKLFTIKESRARELIRKATGYSSHYLRHSRATHLVQEFNLDAFLLMRVLGHTNLGTVTTYVHRKTSDIAEKMLSLTKQ